MLKPPRNLRETKPLFVGPRPGGLLVLAKAHRCQAFSGHGVIPETPRHWFFNNRGFQSKIPKTDDVPPQIDPQPRPSAEFPKASTLLNTLTLAEPRLFSGILYVTNPCHRMSQSLREMRYSSKAKFGFMLGLAGSPKEHLHLGGSPHRWPFVKVDGPGKWNETYPNQWNPSIFEPNEPKKDT